MTNEEIANLYQELGLKFEEEFYVECGFEAATKRQEELVSKILEGNLSKKDISEIEPVFTMGGYNIHDLIKRKKILGLF